MTTKVLIVNHGPDFLLVRTFAKDNEPGDNDMYFSAAEFLSPATSKEFYVHSNQGLLLDEDKKGQFAPPEPHAMKEGEE